MIGRYRPEIGHRVEVLTVRDEGSGGLVVPPGNVAGMAAGLERLMKDRDLRVRLGEAGEQSVQRFAPERGEALFALLER